MEVMKWPKVCYLILCSFLFTDILFFASFFMCRPFLYLSVLHDPSCNLCVQATCTPFPLPTRKHLAHPRPTLHGSSWKIWLDGFQASLRIQDLYWNAPDHSVPSNIHIVLPFSSCLHIHTLEFRYNGIRYSTHAGHNLNERIGVMASAPASYSGSTDKFLNRRVALRPTPVLSYHLDLGLPHGIFSSS